MRRKRGTGSIEHGYVIIEKDGVRKRAHVWIVEAILGRELPPKAKVHHVNGDKMDNANSNLVVCPNQAYHMLLHQRQDALDACGHADWLKCPFCKQYDAPEKLKMTHRPGRPGTKKWFHARCAADYVKARYIPRGTLRPDGSAASPTGERTAPAAESSADGEGAKPRE